MQGSIILSETLSELRLGTRRIVHQGGSWSGKTVNVLGALATVCAEDDKPGDVTTITSMSFPHLKGGAMRDFETYIVPSFKSAIRKYHKTDHLYTFKSGALLEFKTFEDEMKARGMKRKRLFVNEANHFPWMTYFQLDGRSEQSIIDYNPSARFWAHEELIGKPGTETLYSDHRDNLFLTEAKHREIEGYKGEMFKVYSRGITGNVTGVIFPNWQIIDDEDMPKDDEDWTFSIDFGYTNDPTAITKTLLIGNTLFVKEIGYEAGLPPKSIRQILLANGYREDMVMFCEHDPDMVRALRMLGIKAILARKGAGSVNAGIELLHTFDVKYSNKSVNLHRERGMYIWTVEKDTGRTLNVPVDNNNHTFDAIRYGVYSRYLRQGR